MKTNYRWETAKHWLNLTFLGAVGIGAVVGGLPVLALGAALEAAGLWILPDLKSVRRALDVGGEVDNLERHRRYYLKSLWNLEPDPPINPFKALFVEQRTNWARMVGRDLQYRPVGRTGDEEVVRQKTQFRRMVEIVGELRGLRQVRPEAVTEAQILRLDLGINQWLALLATAEGLGDAIASMDRETLAQEFRELEEARERAADDRTAQIVLSERLANLQRKVETLPKLEARKGLALAQAEKLVHEVESFHSQVKASGGGVVDSLEGMVDAYDLLQADFDQVQVEREVQGFLTSSPATDDDAWVRVRKGLALEKQRQRHG